MTPSERGACTEAKVASALVECGKDVYFPVFGANGRVDLVYEDEDGFHRVQCKTGRLVGGTVSFRACSNTDNLPRRYWGEIDVFAVYCPDNDTVYLVPVEVDMPLRPSLRIRPTKNNQAAGVRWATDYELSREDRAGYRGGPLSALATVRAGFAGRACGGRYPPEADARSSTCTTGASDHRRSRS